MDIFELLGQFFAFGSAEAAAEDKAEHGSHPDADRDGLIRMFSHRHVGRARAFGRFVTHPPIGFLAFLKRGRETIARFHDFFSGRVGGDSDEGACVLGKLREVIPNGFSLFIHIWIDWILILAKNSLRRLPRRLRPGRKFFGAI